MLYFTMIILAHISRLELNSLSDSVYHTLVISVNYNFANKESPHIMTEYMVNEEPGTLRFFFEEI